MYNAEPVEDEDTRPEKIGIVTSAFDLCHAGHLLFLEDARKHCDYLVACLQTDPSIERSYKNKPVESLEERMIRLRACKYIDKIEVYTTEEELYEIVRRIKPYIYIMGSDWIMKEHPIKQMVKEVYYHDRSHGFSSSNLRKKIYIDESKKILRMCS